MIMNVEEWSVKMSKVDLGLTCSQFLGSHSTSASAISRMYSLHTLQSNSKVRMTSEHCIKLRMLLLAMLV